VRISSMGMLVRADVFNLTPFTMRRIPLYSKKTEKPSYYTLVDDGDYEEVSKHRWYVNARGYAAWNERLDKVSTQHYHWRLHLMHREIMRAQKGQILDHADGDKLNNQKSNLRFCTHSENMSNTRYKKFSKSGYRGVREFHTKKGWYGAIRKDKVFYWSSVCRTPVEAAIWYNDMARKLHGEFAVLNEVHLPINLE
jgi:hypothetical protein